MVDVNTNPLYYAAIGGLILGTATSFNYMVRGKVTGMSGIIYGVASLNKKQIPQKISTIGGMLFMSGLFFLIFEYQTTNSFTPYGPPQKILQKTSYLGYAIAGLLVGFGTKLSNGCTSGHGLCGLARFSIRSLVAVITFLLTAIAISTLRHYVTLGPFSSQQLSPQISYNHTISASVILGVGFFMPIIGGFYRLKQNIDLEDELEAQQIKQKQNKIDQKSQKIKKLQEQIESGKIIVIDQILTFVVGIIFGLGLLISGMTRRINIIGFLQMGEGWNPSLLFVLGCGVSLNLVFFTYMRKIRKIPFFRGKLFDPNNNLIDIPLVLGAACFGLGWGIGGICPGPALMLASVWNIPIHLIWFGCLLMGMLLAFVINKAIFEKKPEDKETNKIFDANHEIKNSELIKNDDTDKKNYQKQAEGSGTLNILMIRKSDEQKDSKIKSKSSSSSGQQNQSKSQLKLIYNERNKGAMKRVMDQVQDAIDQIEQKEQKIDNDKTKIKQQKQQIKLKKRQQQQIQEDQKQKQRKESQWKKTEKIIKTLEDPNHVMNIQQL